MFHMKNPVTLVACEEKKVGAAGTRATEEEAARLAEIGFSELRQIMALI
jgi:hypothetical protein